VNDERKLKNHRTRNQRSPLQRIKERILIYGVGRHIYTVLCGGLEHLKRGGWTKITKVDQKTRKGGYPGDGSLFIMNR
jgi:hypothetical protein